LCRGLDIPKIYKTPLVCSVSYFNLGGFELCLGGLSPPRPHGGDGTGQMATHLSLDYICIYDFKIFDIKATPCELQLAINIKNSICSRWHLSCVAIFLGGSCLGGCSLITTLSLKTVIYSLSNKKCF